MNIETEFNKAAAAAKFECSAYTVEQIPESVKPEIVFSGKSNVGKSSMINRLINRKSLARVSSEPGKTASINFYDCGIFTLVDLPGYGFAKVSHDAKLQWSELVEGYFKKQRNLRLVVQLADSRHKTSELDLSMIDYMLKLEIPFVVAMTKSDKLKRTQLETRKKEGEEELSFCKKPIIFTSAQTSMGFDILKTEIYKSLE